jgi:hypothetical protein
MGEQVRGESVVAGRKADVELTMRAFVELRRPPRAGTRATRSPRVGDRQEPLLRQPVQVVRGERAADAQRPGDLVAANRVVLGADVVVGVAAGRIGERAQRTDGFERIALRENARNSSFGATDRQALPNGVGVTRPPSAPA